jgi:TPR repeat protein
MTSKALRLQAAASCTLTESARLPFRFTPFAFAVALILLLPAGGVAAESSGAAKTSAQLQAACDKGDGQACYDLGLRYQKGQGVAKNPDRAVALYERSCAIGDAGNCWYLGTVYEDGGFGLVTPDVNRAAGYYRKGCDKADGDACFSLGLLYKTGKGVPYDPAAAAAFIRKGCVALASGFCEDSGGFAVAMSGLGPPARPPASPARAAPAARSTSAQNKPATSSASAPPVQTSGGATGAAPPRTYPPIDPNSTLGRGIRLYYDLEYQRAWPILLEATRADPQDARGFAYLGAAYHRLGMRPESEAARDRALALDPGILSNPAFKF